MATIDERHLADTIERHSATPSTDSMRSDRSSVSTEAGLRSSPSTLSNDSSELSETDQEDRQSDIEPVNHLPERPIERDFEVDHILDKKTTDQGIVFYKVKWKPTKVAKERVYQGDDGTWRVEIAGGPWPDVANVDRVDSTTARVDWHESWRSVWQLCRARSAIREWHLSNDDPNVIPEPTEPAFWKKQEPESIYEMRADTDVSISATSAWFQPTDGDLTLAVYKYAQKQGRLTEDTLHLMNRPPERGLLFSEAFLRSGKEVNIGRATTFQALLAYCVGFEQSEQCSSCASGKSPVPKCVSLEGYFRSACVGCAILGGVKGCLWHSKNEFERLDKFGRCTARDNSTGASDQVSNGQDDMDLVRFLDGVLSDDGESAPWTTPAPGQRSSPLTDADAGMSSDQPQPWSSPPASSPNQQACSPVPASHHEQQSKTAKHGSFDADPRSSPVSSDDELYYSTPRRCSPVPRDVAPIEQPSFDRRPEPRGASGRDLSRSNIHLQGQTSHQDQRPHPHHHERAHQEDRAHQDQRPHRGQTSCQDETHQDQVAARHQRARPTPMAHSIERVLALQTALALTSKKDHTSSSRTGTPGMTLAFRPGPSSSARPTPAPSNHHSSSPGQDFNVHANCSGLEFQSELPHSPGADSKPTLERKPKRKRSDKSHDPPKQQHEKRKRPRTHTPFNPNHPTCEPLRPCKSRIYGQPDYTDLPSPLVYSDDIFTPNSATTDQVRYILSQCNCSNAETLSNLARDSFAVSFEGGDREGVLGGYTWEGELSGRFWQQLNGAVGFCPSRGAAVKGRGREGEVVDLTGED